MICDGKQKRHARKDYGLKRSRSFCKPRDNQPPGDGDLWKKVSPVSLDEELPEVDEDVSDDEEPAEADFPSASSAYIWINSRWRFDIDLPLCQTGTLGQGR